MTQTSTYSTESTCTVPLKDVVNLTATVDLKRSKFVPYVQVNGADPTFACRIPYDKNETTTTTNK